jgi:hypothetical protein
VFEPLVITDMVLALLAIGAGIVVGRMASGATGGLRRWLPIMAALVAARLVVPSGRGLITIPGANTDGR